MAFTYGFYDSLDGDRKYTAGQFGKLFDGLITDGVFATIGDMLMVEPGETGLSVNVKTGKAWFNQTWNENDSVIVLNLDDPDPLLSRMDAIVLEVNGNEAYRENTIKIVKGTMGLEPQKPNLIKEDEAKLWQYALAYVTVPAAATTIQKQDVSNVVGTNEETPFVTGIVKTTSIEDLFIKWEGEFEVWFDNVKAQLTGDVVTNLQKQIDERVKISDKATSEDIATGSDTKWLTPKGAKEASFSSGEFILARTAPSGFRECNGEVLTVSDNQALFDKIRYNYGTGWKVISRDDTEADDFSGQIITNGSKYLRMKGGNSNEKSNYQIFNLTTCPTVTATGTIGGATNYGYFMFAVGTTFFIVGGESTRSIYRSNSDATAMETVLRQTSSYWSPMGYHITSDNKVYIWFLSYKSGLISSTMADPTLGVYYFSSPTASPIEYSTVLTGSTISGMGPTDARGGSGGIVIGGYACVHTQNGWLYYSATDITFATTMAPTAIQNALNDLHPTWNSFDYLYESYAKPDLSMYILVPTGFGSFTVKPSITENIINFPGSIQIKVLYKSDANWLYKTITVNLDLSIFWTKMQHNVVFQPAFWNNGVYLYMIDIPEGAVASSFSYGLGPMYASITELDIDQNSLYIRPWRVADTTMYASTYTNYVTTNTRARGWQCYSSPACVFVKYQNTTSGNSSRYKRLVQIDDTSFLLPYDSHTSIIGGNQSLYIKE